MTTIRWPRLSRAGAAVLGTGIMGSAMARNLVTAGPPTTVWDRSAAVTRAARGGGGGGAPPRPTRSGTPRWATTMLPDAEVVESVTFAAGPPPFAPGAEWAQMGTIGVSADRRGWLLDWAGVGWT